MADYTLKIDIDEADFTRKLQKAMAKAGFSGGFGGAGAGGGAGVGTGDRFDRAHKNKMAQMDREFELRGRHWLGRAALESGSLSQKFEQNKELTKLRGGLFGKKQAGDKFSAQLVKIAGFTIGMTGLASFAKGVIDSSPILQAYLKILTTGIMFILRPIGDTIGFFLKPLALGLLRYAIPWYQASLGITSKAQEVGEAALTGDPIILSKAYDEFGDLILPEAWVEWKKDVREGHEAWMSDFVGEWNKFWDPENINIPEWMQAGATSEGEGGESPNDMLANWFVAAKEAIVNFFTMDKDAGPGGEDSPHNEPRRDQGSKTITREAFAGLVKLYGTSGALAYMEEKGLILEKRPGATYDNDYTVGTTGQPGRGGGFTSGPGGGTTVSIQNLYAMNPREFLAEVDKVKRRFGTN